MRYFELVKYWVSMDPEKNLTILAAAIIAAWIFGTRLGRAMTRRWPLV
jgi:hypothetical protein